MTRRTITALVAVVAIGLAVTLSTGAPAGADALPTTTTEPTTTVPPTPEPTPVAPAPTPPPAPPTWEQIVAFFRSLLPPAPAGSGSGRRIVYTVSGGRVWLIGDADDVQFSYRVSGRAGMPKPGVYSIYSKSRYARSGAVTMQYMMRFARGSKLAIGFHSIPARRNGTLLQTEAELGLYRSHGCVRQALSDAAMAWDWAPLGTRVVVMP